MRIIFSILFTLLTICAFGQQNIIVDNAHVRKKVILRGDERNRWPNMDEINAVADTSAVTDFEEGDILVLADTLLIRDSLQWLVFVGGGDPVTNLAFDGNRPILRVPTVGTIIGTDSLLQWHEWWYFDDPTISISSLSLKEIGTSSTYAISGSISNPGGATLSNGYLRETSPSIDTLAPFGASTSYGPVNITFAPLQTPSGQYTEHSYTFQAKQSWVFGIESGTATANRTINAVYPVFYGMSATDFSDTSAYPGLVLGTDPYTTFSKLIETEGNKAVTFTGTNEYMYYFIPTTWADVILSQIRDHNEFDVTASFTAYDVTLSSTGLTNDYTNVQYKMYKLNTLTTANGFEYDFLR